MSKPRLKPISFKADSAEDLAAFTALAAGAGLSPGLWAKQLAYRALRNPVDRGTTNAGSPNADRGGSPQPPPPSPAGLAAPTNPLLELMRARSAVPADQGWPNL